MTARAQAALLERPPGQLAMVAAGAAAGLMLVAALFYVASGQASLLATMGLLFGPIIALLALVRPVPALVILAAMIAIHAGTVLRDVHGAPGIAKAILLLVVVGMLVRGIWRRGMLRSTPLILAIVLFAIARLLSALPDPGASQIFSLAEGLVTGLAIVAVLGAVGASATWLKILPKAVFGAIAALSVLTLTQAVGIQTTLGGFAPATLPSEDQLRIFARGGTLPEQFSRLRGPVDDPNFWAQSLVLLLPLGLWWFQTSRRPLERAVVAIGMLAVLAAILQTESRGGLLALIVAIVVLGALSRGPMRRVAAVIPLILIVGVIATGQLDRVTALTDLRTDPAAAQDEALTGRLSENLAALAMFEDRPVIGIGAERFEENYSDYAATFGIDDRIERQAHNSYLEMAAESGILGLGTFIGMLVVGFALAIAARRRLKDAGDADMALLAEVMIAGLAAYSVAAIFLHQAFPEYLWLGLGLIAAIHYYATRRAGNLAHDEDPEPSAARAA